MTMTTDPLRELVRVPPEYCNTFVVPVATVIRDLPLTREALLPAIGAGVEVGGWKIQYLADTTA